MKGDKDFLVLDGKKEIAIEGGGNYRGFDYLITMNDMAFRCGYVAITSKNKAYETTEDYPYFEVHGGVTFFQEPHLIKSDCGDKWIGFDAGHGYDIHDVEKALLYFGDDNENLKYIKERDWPNLFLREPAAQIRNFEYMENECKSLIDQIITMDEAS
jgi:hypothetical protein